MGKSKKALIALAAVAGVAVVVLLIACGGGASADEVRFQNVSDAGPKPFTPPTDVPKASSRSARADTTGSGSSTSAATDPSRSGGSDDEGKPGAIGGSGQNTVCDREKLIAELVADPDKLSPWADAVGINSNSQSVAAYIRKLRPVTLTRDTQVTDHFYDDGTAKGYQAILPKGTAALVDEDGTPVARCRSGNPLAEPVELERETRCVNCPANYQPPPPCEDECYRPEPNPPPVKPPTAPVMPPTDPIPTAKTELEKCRKDKGGLEQCKTEYEKARQLCAANPLNPLCDSSICFDVMSPFASDGCSSYIDRGDTLGFCLTYEEDAVRKNACLKNLDEVRTKCGADPARPECIVDPKQKALILRRECSDNGARPECKVFQVACAKNAEAGCGPLRRACRTEPDRPDCKALSDFKQACAKDPTPPDCQGLPKQAAPGVAAPGPEEQEQPEGQGGDQGTGDEGTGEDPGGGDSGGEEPGGDGPGGEAPGTGDTQQPENTPPPEGR